MTRHRETGTMRSRRKFLATGAAAVAGLAAGHPAVSAAAKLLRTPAQSLGPFYPDVMPLDTDNDLVSIEGGKGISAGRITHIFGRILDLDGRPVPGARTEIWQCDAFGRYIHSADAGRGRSDGNFQGYGATVTGADGGYRFRTIKPVPYTGRAPHIHFAVKGPGAGRLVTQMYVAGEPDNDRDFLLARVTDERARRALIVPLTPMPELEAGALGGRFDIVLGAGSWPFG